MDSFQLEFAVFAAAERQEAAKNSIPATSYKVSKIMEALRTILKGC